MDSSSAAKVVDRAGDLVEGGADAVGASRAARATVLSGLLVFVGGGLVLGFWRAQGTVGLSGAGLGLLAGGVIALLGHALKHRARAATGPRVVTAMMAATFASFGLFITLVLLVAFLWREAMPAVALSALGIYLTSTFFEAIQG